MPKEVWGGVAGQTYAALNEEFANGNVVMYESGSWQIGQFAKTIGDAFDWWAMPAPCGPAACSGLPGGAGRGGGQIHAAPGGGGARDGMAGERAGHEGVRRAHAVHPRPQGARREGPRLPDRQCERQARARRLRRGDGEVRAGRQAHAGLQVGGRDLRRRPSPAWARSWPARSRSTTPMRASPRTSSRRSPRPAIAQADLARWSDARAGSGAGSPDARPIGAASAADMRRGPRPAPAHPGTAAAARRSAADAGDRRSDGLAAAARRPRRHGRRAARAEHARSSACSCSLPLAHQRRLFLHRRPGDLPREPHLRRARPVPHAVRLRELPGAADLPAGRLLARGPQHRLLRRRRRSRRWSSSRSSRRWCSIARCGRAASGARCSSSRCCCRRSSSR